MSVKSYDKIGAQWFVPVAPAGVAVDGTLATALALTQGTGIAVPFACKLTKAKRLVVLGATAAVAAASCHVVKSVGGTGTLSAIGTFVYTGTQATATVDTATIATGTAANLAENDVVGISECIGTVAVINTYAFSFGFDELFE